MKFDHIFIAPKDWDTSFDFYKNNLGFEVISSWGEKPEPRGAVLKNGTFTVVIAEEHANKGDEAWEEGKGFNGFRPTVHLNVDNVDATFEKIQNKETAVIKPEDNHWGSRWMVVKDPDDNLIAFNTPKEQR